MKHNRHNTPVPTAEHQLMPVRFEFTHPTAAHVCIAGCFNHWDAEAKAMHPLGEGRWFRETSLVPGTYEYRLVVDGHWIADPNAHETVPNPYGGLNSVLKVAPRPEPEASAAEHRV